jgi:hypothetical protein
VGLRIMTIGSASQINDRDEFWGAQEELKNSASSNPRNWSRSSDLIESEIDDCG